MITLCCTVRRKKPDYKANRRVFHLSNASGGQMDVIFQVSDDGVAFCYSFPGSSDDVKNITSEKTGFNFVAGTTGWIQPRAASKSGWNQCNPSYEEHYLEEVRLDSISPENERMGFSGVVSYENLLDKSD